MSNTISEALNELNKIEEEYLCEMARVTFLKKYGNVEIYVHTDDGGNVPHFHLRKKGDSGFEWECCIRYDCCDYFSHGRDTDTLPDKKYANELDRVLRLQDPDEPDGVTYWTTAVKEWNRNNSSMKLDKNIVQPNYTQLQ